VQKDSASNYVSVKKRTRYPITAEDRVVFLTAGGGGWGDPLERDPELVATDVREGYISAEKAADYGVVLKSSEGEVDVKGTNAMRARLRQRKKD
jgi:N-methylhydantoinase B